MKFDRVALENFKPYADTSVEFDEGVTVVAGANGSGKSSLLEACFFALYGSDALSGGRTLDEVVRTGTDEATVSLAFTHDGEAYRIHRRLRVYDDRVDHDCRLEGADAAIEGATDVAAFVTDLLRMDAEAFANCAYVRQGEVNKLIAATPSTRREMMDDLLQLGRLGDYADRAGSARLGAEDVLERTRGRIDVVTDRIERKESEDLRDRLSDLRSELSTVEDEYERFEANREEAEATLSSAEEVISTFEERREELTDVEAEIETVEEAVREDEREREELATAAREAEDRAEELAGQVDDLLDETDLDEADPAAVDDRRSELVAKRESVGERIGGLTEEIGGLEERIDEARSAAAEARERAAEERERAAALTAEADELAADAVDDVAGDDLEAALDAVRGRFDDVPVDPGGAADHREAVAADLETAREQLAARKRDRDRVAARIEEAEALIEAGNCPKCGRPVDGSPRTESLEEDRARLDELEAAVSDAESAVERHEERLERAEDLVAAEGRIETLEARAETVETKRAAAADCRERAEESADEADEHDSTAAELEAELDRRREELGALNGRRAELGDAIARLDELREAIDARDEARSTAADHRDRRAELAERNDERRDRLEGLRRRRDELREVVDEDRLAAAREDRERATEYLARVERKLEELRERRDELRDRISRVEGEIADLEELQETRRSLRDRIERLETLCDDVERVEAMYGDLRAELRQRNVAALERLLNETFDLVYANDAYARLDLDESYELSVVQKDGDRLAPDQLSGGERALFNLSLRAAVYRLLAEGIEGTAPMPPLVLDEPTVFLDSGHVARLVDLVTEMRDLGVPQTLIVSHDDDLVDALAADSLVRVEKDPTTNQSTVRREAPASPGTPTIDD